MSAIMPRKLRLSWISRFAHGGQSPALISSMRLSSRSETHLARCPAATPTHYHRQVDATQINSTWILNPTTVVTARYGNNRFPNVIAEVSQGFDTATLGFPASYTSNIQSNFFPTIFPRNFSQLGQKIPEKLT